MRIVHTTRCYYYYYYYNIVLTRKFTKQLITVLPAEEDGGYLAVKIVTFRRVLLVFFSINFHLNSTCIFVHVRKDLGGGVSGTRTML